MGFAGAKLGTHIGGSRTVGGRSAETHSFETTSVGGHFASSAFRGMPGPHWPEHRAPRGLDPNRKSRYSCPPRSDGAACKTDGRYAPPEEESRRLAERERRVDQGAA